MGAGLPGIEPRPAEEADGEPSMSESESTRFGEDEYDEPRRMSMPLRPLAAPDKRPLLGEEAMGRPRESS